MPRHELIADKNVASVISTTAFAIAIDGRGWMDGGTYGLNYWNELEALKICTNSKVPKYLVPYLNLTSIGCNASFQLLQSTCGKDFQNVCRRGGEPVICSSDNMTVVCRSSIHGL